MSDRHPGIRPHPGLWLSLDTAARYALPGAQTTAVLLLLSAPFGIPGQAQLQPAWATACVFFWSLYRPTSLPALLVFAIGLLLDLLAQGPIGVHVFILLLVHAAALRLRRTLTRSGFATVWLMFCVVAAASAVGRVAAGEPVQLAPAATVAWRMFEFGIAAGFYPFLAYYLIALHRSVAAPERAG